MNLLYCGDRNTEQGILLSVLSVIKHVSDPLQVHLLTATIPTTDKTYLPMTMQFAKDLEGVLREANSDSFVALHDVTQQFFAKPPRANMDTRFTPCCMLRLFADQVTSLPDKILYLDYDVLANAPLDEMWSTDITDVELAGVLDYYGKWFFHNEMCWFDYMNSGVLLLNMTKIRKTGLFEKCRDLCAQKRMFMPDQSALNKLASRKMRLPRRFNEQHKYSDDTVLQHFSTSFRLLPYAHTVSVKPWQIEQMHEVLRLHAYDDVLEKFLHISETINLSTSV